VERPVGVRRRIVGGRRASGPNGYPPPGRLERIDDRQEAVRERRVHDEHGMDVRRDGRVAGEDGKGARPIAVLARAGRGVVAEGERERPQVTLRRALRLADAFEFFVPGPKAFEAGAKFLLARGYR
jgi:hypothetical protein